MPQILEVTQEIIKRSKPRCNQNCPIANTIKKSDDYNTAYVLVERLGTIIDEWHYIHSESIKEIIYAYDHGHEIKPFTIEIWTSDSHNDSFIATPDKPEDIIENYPQWQ